MGNKQDINTLLDNPPALRQPKGVHLSTDLVAEQQTTEVQKSTNAQKHKSTHVQEDPRPSKGYKVRTDIAQALKVLASQRREKFYKVMEEALLNYLRRNGIDLPPQP